MRAALLTMLAGCSFLIPPRAWHPLDEDVTGERSCPSVAYPITDGVIGGLFLAIGVSAEIDALRVQGNDFRAELGRDIDYTITTYALVPALPLIASAVYGAVRSSSCHDELAGRT